MAFALLLLCAGTLLGQDTRAALPAPDEIATSSTQTYTQRPIRVEVDMVLVNVTPSRTPSVASGWENPTRPVGGATGWGGGSGSDGT